MRRTVTIALAASLLLPSCKKKSADLPNKVETGDSIPKAAAAAPAKEIDAARPSAASSAAAQPSVEPTSFENAIDIVSTAISKNDLRLLAPVVPSKGIAFHPAPEGAEGDAKLLDSDDLTKMHAKGLKYDHEWNEHLDYIYSVFYGSGEQPSEQKVDAKAHTLDAFACDMCEFRFHFAEQNGRWVVVKIVAADFEP